MRTRGRKGALKNSVCMVAGFISFLLLPVILSAVQPVMPSVKGRASDFSLADLSGKQVSLSGFRGKPVMLFFWASWCPFCSHEIAELQRQYPQVKKEGIEVLMINVGESIQRVLKFLGENKTGFPVLLDTENKVAALYNLIGVPTYILIDSQGIIVSETNSFPREYIQILKGK